MLEEREIYHTGRANRGVQNDDWGGLARSWASKLPLKKNFRNANLELAKQQLRLKAGINATLLHGRPIDMVERRSRKEIEEELEWTLASV